MDPNLDRIAKALSAGTGRRLSAPYDQAALDHLVGALEAEVSATLPSDYKTFLNLTSGSGVVHSASGTILYSGGQLAFALEHFRPLFLVSESTGARGLVIGAQGESVLVLRISPHAKVPIVSCVARPANFVQPGKLEEMFAAASEQVASPFMDYLEHSWREDLSWTRVGWGF